MNGNWILYGLLALLAAACAPVTAPTVDLPPRAEINAPPPAVPTTPGSLWSAGQGSLVTDLKARGVGDIVTVAIFEKASASKNATTSTGRDSTMSAGISRLFGLEENIGNINSAIDPSALVSAKYKNEFTGSGSTSRKEDLVATLTTYVTDMLPNGNMRIEGSKTVTVNNEDQIIRLTGFVRPADISGRNVIDSMHILDARIVYTGKGVISDKQKQGWLVRALDNVWPF
jgi:flagellar L-ring protein precursor FlgH